jgi:hypothetical protein
METTASESAVPQWLVMVNRNWMTIAWNLMSHHKPWQADWDDAQAQWNSSQKSWTNDQEFICLKSHRNINLRWVCESTTTTRMSLKFGQNKGRNSEPTTTAFGWQKIPRCERCWEDIITDGSSGWLWIRISMEVKNNKHWWHLELPPAWRSPHSWLTVFPRLYWHNLGLFLAFHWKALWVCKKGLGSE